MRKNSKRMAALAFTLSLAAVWGTAGYAAVDPTDVTDVTVLDATNASGTQTQLVGTIDVTTLKVTLPLKAGFNIDTSKYDADSFTAQIGNNQSANYKIKNESAIPVWVYISAVDTGKDLTAMLLASPSPWWMRQQV